MSGWCCCITNRSGWLLELLTELKMAIILPTWQWYAPSAVINDEWYCMVLTGISLYGMVLHGIAWYCMILHYLALPCTILHYLALSCTILHYLALSCTILHNLALSCTILHIRYTCIQHMSPVVAFDIAVGAQKVKVQCCYILANMLNQKKCVGWW